MLAADSLILRTYVFKIVIVVSQLSANSSISVSAHTVSVEENLAPESVRLAMFGSLMLYLN